MTLNEIVYDIMELVRGNSISDDTEIDEEHVAYLVDVQRALWIRNEYNKPNRNIDDHIEQDLGCVPLVEADPSECCELSTDCTVVRTSKKIPDMIEFHNGAALTRVGPVNKYQKPYSLVSYNQALYSGNGKYNKNILFVFLLNDYIYLVSNNPKKLMMDHINVRGIFENPREVSNFSDCETNKPCFSWDDPYPINSWMIPYIKEQVLKQLGASTSMPKDDANDAQEILNKQ